MRIWQWDADSARWQQVVVPRGDALDISPLARVVALGACGGLLVKGPAGVNGSPVLPLAILDDRDEIALSAASVHVSVDPAEAAPFRSDGGEIECARCRAPLCSGDVATRCPSCQAWYHEGPLLACWSYDAACAACALPTTTVWEPESPPTAEVLR